MAEATKVMRVPVSLVADVEKYIAHYRNVAKYKMDPEAAMKKFKESTGCMRIDEKKEEEE